MLVFIRNGKPHFENFYESFLAYSLSTFKEECKSLDNYMKACLRAVPAYLLFLSNPNVNVDQLASLLTIVSNGKCKRKSYEIAKKLVNRFNFVMSTLNARWDEIVQICGEGSSIQIMWDWKGDLPKVWVDEYLCNEDETFCCKPTEKFKSEGC